MDKPAPVPDQFSAFYWENAAQGRLALQACAECDHVQFPPNAVCENCQSPSLSAKPTNGRGTLYAMTVMRQAFHPAWAHDLPYVIAQVELDDAPGIRIQTNIVQADPADLKAGDPLEAVFEQRGEMTLPQFRPAHQNGT
ncbi:Zn-ribbon domain-containing OB-fold protein [Streptomyces sp. NPDC059373]